MVMMKERTAMRRLGKTRKRSRDLGTKGVDVSWKNHHRITFERSLGRVRITDIAPTLIIAIDELLCFNSGK